MLRNHKRACSVDAADAQTLHGLTNSVQALRCPRPLSHRPGSPFLSKPANAVQWVAPLGSALSQELVVALGHASWYVWVWLLLKGGPSQAVKTQSLWFFSLPEFKSCKVGSWGRNKPL